MSEDTEPMSPVTHFVSRSCCGEKCSVCRADAMHKLGEEIMHDDPNPNRHILTAYVCCEHFRMIVGSCGAAYLPPGTLPGILDSPQFEPSVYEARLRNYFETLAREADE